MIFLRTSSGLLNIDLIEKVWESKNRNDFYRSRAFLKDGNTEILIRDSLDDIETEAAPVVAANPGFFVIRCLTESLSGFFVEKAPIVAWRIAKGTMAEPITIDDEHPAINEVGHGILLPSGEIINPYEGRYDNEEDWLKSITKPKSQNET